MSMRMLSTRGIAPPASISDAIAAGLAPDGGVFAAEKVARGLDADGEIHDLANVLRVLFGHFRQPGIGFAQPR